MPGPPATNAGLRHPRTSPLPMSIRTFHPDQPPRPRCLALTASEAMALMAAPGTGAEGEGSRKASGLNGAKILLVEDEFLIALDLQILLYRLGCDVLGP